MDETKELFLPKIKKSRQLPRNLKLIENYAKNSVINTGLIKNKKDKNEYLKNSKINYKNLITSGEIDIRHIEISVDNKNNNVKSIANFANFNNEKSQNSQKFYQKNGILKNNSSPKIEARKNKAEIIKLKKIKISDKSKSKIVDISDTSNQKMFSINTCENIFNKIYNETSMNLSLDKKNKKTIKNMKSSHGISRKHINIKKKTLEIKKNKSFNDDINFMEKCIVNWKVKTAANFKNNIFKNKDIQNLI